MTIDDLTPWKDRAGRFSALRAATFALLAAPALWLLALLALGWIGPEPEKAATHFTGEWTLYFLLAALAVSPLRAQLGYGRLIGLRRMIGLFAFGFIAAHFGLYILYMNGDLLKVATEVVNRVYLTIGFAALLGLAALAATSFDRAIRRMGANWRRLHALVYPLTALGLLHYFMQSKLDVSQPALLAGIFCGLMLLRLRRLKAAPPALVLLLAALLAGVSAAGLEAAWHAGMTGAPWRRILLANLDFSFEVRPPWIAAAIMVAPILLLPRYRQMLRSATQS